MQMNTPPLYENSIVSIWQRDDGIVHAKIKTNDISFDHIEETIQFIDKQFKGEKIKCSLDIKQAQQSKKVFRNQVSKILPKYIDALAVIGGSPISRVLFNVYKSLWPKDFIIKLFPTQKEAHQWLNTL